MLKCENTLETEVKIDYNKNKKAPGAVAPDAS